MKNLQIDSKKARGLYSTASNELKVMLEDTFGKSFFSQNPIDYIKTLEDAIVATGDALIINESDTKDEIAYKKLKIIYKALNNDSKFPDWNNSMEYKYYPWIKKTCSGVGISYDGFHYTFSFTFVGSRLVLKNSELCKYVAEQFGEILSDYMF